MIKPTPTNIEKIVKLDTKLILKTDRTGSIIYLNFDLANLSEYEVEELIGKDISCLNHPDMPSFVFDYIWNNLFQKKRTVGIVKNITKSGSYYWLQINIDFKVNEETHEIENIYIHYSKASEQAKKELSVFYKKIKDIEIHSNTTVAENYLTGFLDNASLDFDSFIKQYTQ